MKLAAVIQRYGAEVAGGAEAHCRGLLHALRAHHDVEVLATCALDYITWKNHYPAGTTTEDGIRVTRFANRGERDVQRFGAISEAVLCHDHTPAEEREWLLENGPVCPDLVAAVQARPDVDFFLIYSYRYYTATMAAAAVPDRAVLVPTAEDDPAISLAVFSEVFRSARGLLYLTPEEQLLVEGVSRTNKPSAIIGTGLTVTPADPAQLTRFALPAEYVFYGGRIDRNKGVDQLFRYYIWLASTWPDAPALILAGHQVLEVPSHPKVRYLGYVSDDEKAALLAGASIAIMPSAFESLSIFVLEAWAHGTPVLVNAKCKVLEGQCRRSQGGLYYRDLAEFAAMMRMLMSQPGLRRDLGAAGRTYVDREYSWSIAAERTNALLAGL